MIICLEFLVIVMVDMMIYDEIQKVWVFFGLFVVDMGWMFGYFDVYQCCLESVLDVKMYCIVNGVIVWLIKVYLDGY